MTTALAWEWRTRPPTGTTPLTATLTSRGQPVSFRSVIDAWRTDPDSRAFFTARLSEVPYGAYCWEMPPVTLATIGMPYECVFVESSALGRVHPDPGPFGEHFTDERSGAHVVAFESLGRDALLVVPCPRGDRDAYTHLAAFVRLAPPEQADGLWQLLARALDGRLGASPLWLSTAGLGVHWLHVRIDTRPKYHRHRAYAERTSPD